MKAAYKANIGIYTIYTHVADVQPDQEATKRKIAPLVRPEMTDEEYAELFNANLVPAMYGPEADVVSDERGGEIQRGIGEAGKHRKFLTDGGYVADHRCCEYWIKRSGKWAKEKIEEIGVELPGGAVLQEDLTPEQREEIAGQQEAERIAAMPPEDREKAEEAALNALADEADRLERRYKIQGKPFDAKAYYGEGAKKIGEKYKNI